MVLLRALFVMAILPWVAGCGLVHFGRQTSSVTGGGDAALTQAYTNLSTSHKILQQELALARKEGEALRVALERGAGQPGSSATSGRLEELTRELATLRANYARLQAERSATAAGQAPAASGGLAAVEEKLASSQRNFTQWQEENARLSRDLDRTRTENAGLAELLKSVSQQNNQAQAAVVQLNAELLAQRDARGRAEQATAAVRAQMATVMAQAGKTPGTEAAGDAPLSGLQFAKAPPAEASATAELRISPERLRGVPDATSPVPRRIHVVREGDTLDKLARQYYDAPARWRQIYDANEAILTGGRPLHVGMELEIPAP